MAKVTTNHRHKVAQSFGANFYHHETCIMLRVDARNKNLKLRHFASSFHFVMFVFVICSFLHHCFHVYNCSTFSCLFYLLFIYLHIVILHIWFVGHCSLIFTLSFSYHPHVCSFSTINYMHSILQIFVQLFASTFCSNFLRLKFLHNLLCVFLLYLVVTFVKTTRVFNVMDIDDELIAGFLVLLILFMQSLCFHIKMPLFLGFM
jgi:hypothetical protein